MPANQPDISYTTGLQERECHLAEEPHLQRTLHPSKLLSLILSPPPSPSPESPAPSFHPRPTKIRTLGHGAIHFKLLVKYYNRDSVAFTPYGIT